MAPKDEEIKPSSPQRRHDTPDRFAHLKVIGEE
jgi:hypothetical protein